MTARNDPGGSVGRREILEWPHDIHHDLGMRSGHRVDGIVGMEGLGGLAGTDQDADRCAQLAMTEDPVKDTEDGRVNSQSVKGPGLSEQAVDATRQVAFEVVAALRSVFDDRFQFRPGPRHLIR
jgi:hypothetical protein